MPFYPYPHVNTTQFRQNNNLRKNRHLRRDASFKHNPHVLTPGCRRTWPLNLDPSPLYGSHLPQKSRYKTAKRHAGLLETLLAPLSVLGVCKRFPSMDGPPQWA